MANLKPVLAFGAPGAITPVKQIVYSTGTDLILQKGSRITITDTTTFHPDIKVGDEGTVVDVKVQTTGVPFYIIEIGKHLQCSEGRDINLKAGQVTINVQPTGIKTFKPGEPVIVQAAASDIPAEIPVGSIGTVIRPLLSKPLKYEVEFVLPEGGKLRFNTEGQTLEYYRPIPPMGTGQPLVLQEGDEIIITKDGVIDGWWDRNIQPGDTGVITDIEYELDYDGNETANIEMYNLNIAVRGGKIISGAVDFSTSGDYMVMKNPIVVPKIIDAETVAPEQPQEEELDIITLAERAVNNKAKPGTIDTLFKLFGKGE